MASKNIIIDGDIVKFETVPGITLVPPNPKTKIKASGKKTINNKKVCVKGDEKSPGVVANCGYISGSFVGGIGILRIEELEKDQLTQKSFSENKSIILEGSFKCKFEVDTPGKDASGTPDPNPLYSGGKGKFIPSNNKIKAT